MSEIIKTPLRSGEPVVQVSVVGPDQMPVLELRLHCCFGNFCSLGPTFTLFGLVYPCSKVLYCLLSPHEVLSQSTDKSHLQHYLHHLQHT